jgi:hypothetical protein
MILGDYKYRKRHSYPLPLPYCTLPPMSAPRPIVSFALCLLIVAISGHALEQATGVNLTASEGFGARHQGTALTRAGFGQGADVVGNAPASMNDVNDFTFTTAHAEQFGLARFDNIAVLLPLEARSTLGFGFARYGVSGVEDRPETVGQPPSDPNGLFTTSDWMLTGAFARRFGSGSSVFDLGGSVHLLQRHLDQNGLGMRGDAMAQYTHDGRLRGGVFVRGLLPSSAAWSEGHQEYEAPEAVLFVALRKPVPYFYGTLETGFETPGILQPGARSASSLEGERGVTDPVSVLKTSKAGAEFNFDFGLSLRAGFDEIAPSAWTSSARLGMGYNWRNIVAIDYAFAAHPYLDESHRIALRFTPSFNTFEGRNFRPRDPVSVRPEKLRPVYPSPSIPESDNPKPSETPIPPQLDQGKPAESTPKVESAPAAPATPAAPPEPEEELEEGEILEHQ